MCNQVYGPGQGDRLEILEFEIVKIPQVDNEETNCFSKFILFSCFDFLKIDNTYLIGVLINNYRN